MATRAHSWIPDARPAIAVAGLVVAVVVAGCSPATPSAPPSVAAAASATPPATQAPTATPTTAPTPSATAAASPSPATAVAPGCTVAIEPDPDWGTWFYFSGTGFAPDTDVAVTFVEPSSTSAVGGPDGDFQPRLLHTTGDGRFGPWDILYADPNPGDGGDYELRATDGDCTASVAFSLATDATSPSQLTCSIRIDSVPDWGSTFNVYGERFEPRAPIAISVDEPTGLWTWPGELKAKRNGTFGPWDLRYAEPVAGDGGAYVLHASDGSCTADLPFELPEP